MKIKVVLLVVFLLPFCIVSLFNHPAIDDFWSANNIIDHGRAGSVSFYFNTISGRFFSNFLMSMCNTLPNGSLLIFKLWPLVTLLLLIVSFVFFYASFPRNASLSVKPLLVALMFVVLHVANMRVLFEGLYWMSSAVCYQVAICLFVVGIGSLVRYIQSNSTGYGGVAVACSLLLPGSAETLSPVFILVLIVMLVISLKQKYPSRLTVVCLAAAICSLAIIVFSKGTLARTQGKDDLWSRDLPAALFYSARAVGYYWVFWFGTPLNVAALIIALPYLQSLAAKWKPKLAVAKRYMIVLLPLLALLCMGIYLPQIFFETPVPFPRVTTLVFFFTAHFSILFFCAALVGYPRFTRFVTYCTSIRNFRLYAWVFFFITAFSSANFNKVMSDLLSGNAYGFSREAEKRYEIIRNSAGDTVSVARYVHWPFFIQSSPKEDVSFVHMSRYFGKTIVYKKEQSSK